jgi:NADH:ubiquinone oxidoreductase subunit E
MNNEDYIHLLSEFKGEEGDLIPILQKVQENSGYISEGAVKRISQFLRISENQIFGVASFYSQFRFTEPGRNSVKICLGTACHVCGGHILSEAIARELGISPGQTTEDGRFDFQRVTCLGCCALAPVVKINDDIHSRVTVVRLKEILDKYE